MFLLSEWFRRFFRLPFQPLTNRVEIAIGMKGLSGWFLTFRFIWVDEVRGLYRT
jgi:hypothetical protein